MADPGDTAPFTPDPTPASLLGLLAEWDDRYRRGEDPTPEELCGPAGHLVEPLREAIRKRKRLFAFLQPPGGGDEPAPELPGLTIGDRIGQGGMGVVYRAVQTELGRPVAVKMIAGLSPTDPAALARFRAEALSLAKLRHPNIVQIFDVGTEGGRPYIVLELLDGNLAGVLRDAPLPARPAAAVVEAVARAVQHAHDHGILHRDLKPANILLSTVHGPSSLEPSHHGPRTTDHGLTPKVADFGLAKQIGPADGAGATATGVALGTPSYMAPEQASGTSARVGPAADVYALGAILYECLTGRPPFKGATAAETLHHVLTRDPVPPRQLRPGLPADLEAVCLRCLEKDPARRYASAAAVADDLGRFLAGRPTHARPASVPRRVAKWARRNPSAAALVGVSVAFLVALAGVGAWYNARLVRARERAERTRDLVRAGNAAMARLAWSQEALLDAYRIPPPAEVNEALSAAVAAYARVMDDAPDDPDGWDELGRMAAARAKAADDAEATRTAIRALETAARLREARLAAAPADPDRRAALARTRHHLGDIYAAHGDAAEAEQSLRAARELWAGLTGEFPDRREYRVEAAATENVWGRFAYFVRQDYRAALAASLAAVAVLEPDGRGPPPNPRSRSRATHSLSVCALAAYGLGDYAAAVGYWDRALADRTLPEPLRYKFRFNRGFAAAKAGDHRAAAAEADWLERSAAFKAADTAEVAKLLATAVEAAARDPALSGKDRAAAADRYADRAFALLEQARRTGDLKTAAELNDPELRPLSDRPRWRELARRLAK